MTNINIKNKMKIAMVGISPADQITFKGYLRVLLRLDVNLDWVSAQVGEVDLYVVNQDFKNSTSVQKLIELHPHTPILYVSRDLMGEGSLFGDSLVLPLKQINILNEWLHNKVAVLKDLPHQKTNATNISTSSTAEDVLVDVDTTQALKQSVQTREMNAHSAKFSDVIELIKILQTRPKSLFELVQRGEVLAVIDGSRQLMWLKSAKASDIMDWRLRVYAGSTGDPRQAIDMNQWLYQMAWANVDVILPLIDDKTRYQLRSWAKPDSGADRRVLLRAMVAMEDVPRTVNEVVARTGLDVTMVQKIIVSLLFSQHLNSDCYKDIKTSNVMIPKTSIEESNLEPIQIEEPVAAPKTAEQEEKIGFLTRLRRKLGL